MKILIFILFVFFLSVNVSSLDYDNKWQVCNSINLTGKNCDLFWNNLSIDSEKLIKRELKNYYDKDSINTINESILTECSEMINDKVLELMNNINKDYALKSELKEGDDTLNILTLFISLLSFFCIIAFVIGYFRKSNNLNNNKINK